MTKKMNPIRSSDWETSFHETECRFAEGAHDWAVSDALPNELPFTPTSASGGRSGNSVPQIIARIPDWGRRSTEKRKKTEHPSGKSGWMKPLAFALIGIGLGIAVTKGPLLWDQFGHRSEKSPVSLEDFSVSEDHPVFEIDSAVNHLAFSPFTESIESPKASEETGWSEDSLDSIPLWQPEKAESVSVASFPMTPNPVTTPVASVETDLAAAENFPPPEPSLTPYPEVTPDSSQTVFGGQSAKTEPHWEEEDNFPMTESSDRYETASCDAYGFMNASGEFHPELKETPNYSAGDFSDSEPDPAFLAANSSPRKSEDFPEATVKTAAVPLDETESGSVSAVDRMERPMKNQIEYFNPDRGAETSPTRLAATGEFYDGSSRTGNFADYSVPNHNAAKGLRFQPQTGDFSVAKPSPR